MNSALKLQPGVERTRLSDAVYETLFGAILNGELAAGAIVSEVSLAKQLAVSRTPVHDALRQLAKDGLVEQQAGRRAGPPPGLLLDQAVFGQLAQSIVDRRAAHGQLLGERHLADDGARGQFAVQDRAE